MSKKQTTFWFWFQKLFRYLLTKDLSIIYHSTCQRTFLIYAWNFLRRSNFPFKVACIIEILCFQPMVPIFIDFFFQSITIIVIVMSKTCAFSIHACFYQMCIFVFVVVGVLFLALNYWQSMIKIKSALPKWNLWIKVWWIDTSFRCLCPLTWNSRKIRTWHLKSEF